MRALLLGFGLLLVAASHGASAQSVGVTGPRATASVNVLKPLQLTAQRNLQFGTIMVGTFSGTQTVTVATAGRTCGSGAGLTCSGLFSTAQYRVSGTNNQVALVRSTTPTVTLSNGAGSTLVLTPILPSSVAFSNSGNQGVLFEVGGSLSFTSTMADGLYSGTLEIQVSYQ